MKKAIISAAIMVAMGTGLTLGTSAVTPHNEVNAQAATEEPLETQISDTNVTLRMNSSEAEEEPAVEEASPEEPEAVEAPEEEPACEYPEWQNSVVANVEGSLRVRAEANTESEIVGKLYPYTVAAILEPGEEWTRIESGSVTGYVSNEFLMFGDEAGEYITENYKYCATVEVQALNVRQEQSTESECIGSVTGGRELDILSETDEWIEIQYTEDTTGYVAREYVKVGWNYPEAMTIEEEQALIAASLAAQASASQRTASASSAAVLPPVETSAEGLALGQQIASYACQFVGCPYVYGGSSLTGGTDCSGFTMAVYAQFGYSLSHSSGAQMGQGTPVSLDAVQPGDIICYSGHVGLYIGGGQIVHAATESTGIVISNMYYASPIGARRIVQ
ncbi:MAG: C40 family peptidase [Bacteroides sp.]|nr:C40 family peptidase [Bacteroides sp.]MCM1550668.1 C40 family peptidase [Clostridium sp.]